MAANRRRLRLTPRDLELLSFLAEHRLALDAHFQTLLGTSSAAAQARLRALSAAGLVTRRPLFGSEPSFSQIRSAGLAAIGSRLAPPRQKLGQYQHDVGLAWLWLAARGGAFGALREVIAERVMRSRDGAREPGEVPLGVRLGGFGAHGQERLHYPDLLLVTAQAKRIALELELTSKGPRRREEILGGYSADGRVDAVLYLVEKPQLRRAIETSARRMGLSELVHVRYFEWGRDRPIQSPHAGRERTRASTMEVLR